MTTKSATSSERYLLTLARRAFLRMWVYPSLHVTDGQRSKELCDLLLIFGSEVVIFSDKNCHLAVGEEDTRLAWKRWYRKAVLASARQVAGAERAIARGDSVFEDSECKSRLRVALPSGGRIHRVLTVRGAAEAARSAWAGRGSLFVTNRSLNSCSEAPFRLGTTDHAGRFFHIFDENALDVVLATLDTARDFLEYLAKRHAFLSRTQDVVASSEEDLLGLFMRSYREDENSRDFPDACGLYLLVDSSHWDAWASSEQRRARDGANQVSYLWDELIEKFAFHTLNGSAETSTSHEVSEQEPLLRWLASESRFKRRILSESLIEMLQSTKPAQIRRRHHPPAADGSPHWVFLVAPQPPGVSYADYRLVRKELLRQHIFVVKYLHPEATDIVGIAIGETEGDMTEDAMWIDCREWSDEDFQAGRDLRERQGIFRSPVRLSGTKYEYSF
jgi:hypothetical protein